MSHRQLSRREQLLDGVGQSEQAEEVRDRRPLLPNPLRDLFLRQAELLVELVVCVGLFDRVQVLALDVLDQRDLKHVAIGHRFLDDHRHGVQTSLLRRTEPPLTCNETVSVVTSFGNYERLDDAVFADAPRQLLD